MKILLLIISLSVCNKIWSQQIFTYQSNDTTVYFEIKSNEKWTYLLNKHKIKFRLSIITNNTSDIIRGFAARNTSSEDESFDDENNVAHDAQEYIYHSRESKKNLSIKLPVTLQNNETIIFITVSEYDNQKHLVNQFPVLLLKKGD